MFSFKNILKNSLRIIFGVLFVFHGLFFVFVERYTTKRTEVVKQWPTIDGRIEELEYSGDFSYEILYSYVVNGQRYTSDKIIPRFAWFSAMRWKNSLQCTLIDAEGKSHFPRYAKGEYTKVHYNPDNPSDAMLLPFAPSMLLFRYYGIAMTCILFFIPIIGISIGKLKREKLDGGI